MFWMKTWNIISVLVRILWFYVYWVLMNLFLFCWSDTWKSYFNLKIVWQDLKNKYIFTHYKLICLILSCHSVFNQLIYFPLTDFFNINNILVGISLKGIEHSAECVVYVYFSLCHKKGSQWLRLNPDHFHL